MRKIVGSEEMGVLLLLIKGLDLMHVSERKTEKILSLCHDLNTMVPLMNYMADHPDSKPRELVVITEELNMKNNAACYQK